MNIDRLKTTLATLCLVMDKHTAKSIMDKYNLHDVEKDVFILDTVGEDRLRALDSIKNVLDTQTNIAYRKENYEERLSQKNQLRWT